MHMIQLNIGKLSLGGVSAYFTWEDLGLLNRNSLPVYMYTAAEKRLVCPSPHPTSTHLIGSDYLGLQFDQSNNEPEDHVNIHPRLLTLLLNKLQALEPPILFTIREAPVGYKEHKTCEMHGGGK